MHPQRYVERESRELARLAGEREDATPDAEKPTETELLLNFSLDSYLRLATEALPLRAAEAEAALASRSTRGGFQRRSA